MTRKAAWLVPEPIRGSGGHRTIFQNVAALAEAGYDCHVFVEPASARATVPYGDGHAARRVIESLFGPVPATFHLGFELHRDFDVAFATAWFTAAPLRRQARARHKAYFVQDFEAAFFPMGDRFLEAEETFRFGFHGTSIGRWLPHRLGREFGMVVDPFDFCADRSVYRPLQERGASSASASCTSPRSLGGAPSSVPSALAIVKAEMPEVRIELYGNDRKPRLPFEAEHLGLLSVEGCNELYNRSSVGLCISTTNPSRVPFEMMAAGLPVVDLHRENNLFDHVDSAALLAESTPESVAHAVLSLLRDASERSSRSQAGLALMHDRDLAMGATQFVEAVDRLVSGRAERQPSVTEPTYRRPPVVTPDDLRERYRGHLETARARAMASETASPNPTAGWPFRKGSLPARIRKRVRRVIRALSD